MNTCFPYAKITAIISLVLIVVFVVAVIADMHGVEQRRRADETFIQSCIAAGHSPQIIRTERVCV